MTTIGCNSYIQTLSDALAIKGRGRERGRGKRHRRTYDDYENNRPCHSVYIYACILSRRKRHRANERQRYIVENIERKI